MHRVEQAKRLNGAVVQVGGVVLERHHASDVDVPEVHRGTTVDDPVGQDLAGTTGRLDADRVEAAGHEQTLDIR